MFDGRELHRFIEELKRDHHEKLVKDMLDKLDENQRAKIRKLAKGSDKTEEGVLEVWQSCVLIYSVALIYLTFTFF